MNPSSPSVVARCLALSRLFVACASLALFSPVPYAQDNALKDLSERCHSEMQRVNGTENAKCPTNIKDPRYRGCIATASQTSTKAYEQCMGGTPQGACAAREFMNTSRSGVQGLLDRYCALRQCGYSDAQVAALDLTKGRTIGGSGAAAIAVPAGFKWTCPGLPSAQSAPTAAPAASAGPDMGRCKPSPNFKSAGWRCADLRGQVGQFDKYNVPANERFCTSSQIDAMVSANDAAVCSNIVEQGEAVLKKYRDADAAVDMGKCKPAPGVSSTGWQCNALEGLVGQYDKYNVPAHERICTDLQVKTLIARKDVANCSNVINQADAVITRYRKAAEAAAAEAARPKVDMGNCKPNPGIANGGWQCNALNGQTPQFDALKVPPSERICTPEQLAALIALNNRENCSNVVEQREAVLKKYRTPAAATKPQIDMGTCKPNPAVASGGWQCSALNGQTPQFDALKVPPGERVCTPEQLAALIALNHRENCSNVVEQREAVLKAYRDKAAAAKAAPAPAPAAPAQPSSPVASPSGTSAGLEWTTLPGAAVDIGAGGNGQVWVTNASQQIYRLNGDRWTQMPGAAVRIAVDSQGNALVVNQAGALYQWSNNTWAQRPGVLTDVAIGGNTIWGVNSAQNIYRWGGSNWTRMPGLAVRVSVDRQGNAWVANAQGQIYTWQGNGWAQLPGLAKDIAACGNGDVYVIGTNGVPYKWNGSDWARQAGGNLANIACDDQGRVFATTVSQQILASKAQGGAASAPATPTPTAAPAQPAQPAAAADMGRCKPAAGIDGQGWDCRHIMGAFEEYEKYKVPAAEQVCTREQAMALVAAKNDANCGNVAVQVGRVLAKYRAAAAAANTATIRFASYGKNCPNAKLTDVTAKVQLACNGKEKCAYTVSAGVLGDSAPGCAKAFEATYFCPGKGERTLTLAAEANNKIADFDCSK